MFSEKKTTFKLSDDAINFIRIFGAKEIGLHTPINEQILDAIVELATQWEMDMMDPSDANGGDKTYDYPEKKRNEAADRFVTEITGQWDDGRSVPDFDDLNRRLGLH